MSPDPPFEERRHEDRLADWRMNKLEDQMDDFSKTIVDLRSMVIEQFANLRKELFENPTFATIHLLRMELESRDAKIARMERDHSLNIQEIKNSIDAQAEGTVSSRRFTIATAFSAIAIVASIFIAIYLGK
jgi:hypothetical protein